jgi:peptide/nickel transport system substrate-binding protein
MPFWRLFLLGGDAVLAKRFVIVMGLTLLAALGSLSPPMDARGQIKQLTIGIGVDADTLNPQEQTTSLIMNMCALLYDTYLYLTPDGKLEPRLVTRYEVSPDGLRYTLHLREGVKFSDGTPFNAKAVKLSFDRALDPKLRVPLRFVVDMVKECLVVDDFTVQLKLKYPYAPMDQYLSVVTSATISPAAIEKYGDDVRNHPVGAGPFKLSEWVKGDRIVMVRNDDYWGPKPTVEKIIWRIVPDPVTREIMLRSGQIDICYKPPPPDVATLKTDAKIKVDMPLDTRAIFMSLRCDQPVLKDKRVRQAFNYAVDKKGIVKRILFDDAQPMDGPMSPIQFGYAKMGHQYDYNSDKAKQLLKEANFDFNQTIRLATPQGRYLFDTQVAEAVQAYLQAIGVKAELRLYDWRSYMAAVFKVEHPEMDVALMGWGPVVMDGDGTLYGQFHTSVIPPHGIGSAFYSNPKFDKVVEATRIEQDPTKRLELFKKAEEIVWDDCPWLWLYVEKFVIAYSSRIENMPVTSIEMIYPTYITMK